MDARKVTGWRSRLASELDEARSATRAFGPDVQGARTAESIAVFLTMSEAIAEGAVKAPVDEPARDRGVSSIARQKASERLDQVKLRMAQIADALVARAELVASPCRRADRAELLEIRRQNWAERKAEDPEWYLSELAYNRDRRKRKPPPSAKGPERNEKDREAYARRKAEDPEFRERQAARLRQWRRANAERINARRREERLRKKAQGTGPA